MLKDSRLTLSEYNGAVLGALMIAFGVFVLRKDWWQALSSLNVWMEGAHFYIAVVPFSVLDLAGSLIVCIYYRNDLSSRSIYRGTLESLLACTLMQFGGTSFTGGLLGQTPSWLLSHSAFNSLLLAWWLVFFSPFDLFYSLLCSMHTYAIPAISLVAAVSSGHAITSWGVDKVLFNTFHVNHTRLAQSVWVCLFCGVASCCGGTLLKDWLNMMSFPSFTLAKSPVLFEVERRGSPPGSPSKNVGFSAEVQGGGGGSSGGGGIPDSLLVLKRQQQGLLTKCVVLSATYYCLLDPSGYVTNALLFFAKCVPFVGEPFVWLAARPAWGRDDGRLLVVLLQVGHYFYKVFAPSSDDVMIPYMRMFCAIFNVSKTVPVSRV
jgi:hypothetical protein